MQLFSIESVNCPPILSLEFREKEVRTIDDSIKYLSTEFMSENFPLGAAKDKVKKKCHPSP